MPEIKYPNVFMPVDANAAVKAGVVSEADRPMIQEAIYTNLLSNGAGGMTSSSVMSLDIIASNIAQGWKRPCYFAMTVPDNFYLGLTPYLRCTGVAYEVTPLLSDAGADDIPCNTDKMYDIVTTKFRWGGLDTAKPGSLYLDETIRRMVTTTRSALMSLASSLANEGAIALDAQKHGSATFRGKPINDFIADRHAKAVKVLQLMDQKMPQAACPYAMSIGLQAAKIYDFIGRTFADKAASAKAVKMVEDEAMRFATYVRFYQKLDPSMYDRLNNTDQYIDKGYMPAIIRTYGEMNPNGVDALLKRLAATGMNVQRTLSFMQAQQQAAQAEAVDTTMPAGGDTALGSLFGNN